MRLGTDKCPSKRESGRIREKRCSCRNNWWLYNVGTNIIDGNSKLQNGILILSACATACVYGVTFTNCAMAVSTVPASYQRRRSVICAIGDCTGTNNDTGIYASHASLVYDRTTSTLGTIRRTTVFGGLIVDNSGNFVKE